VVGSILRFRAKIRHGAKRNFEAGLSYRIGVQGQNWQRQHVQEGMIGHVLVQSREYGSSSSDPCLLKLFSLVPCPMPDEALSLNNIFTSSTTFSRLFPSH
jgi:hypothetical protein